MGKNEEVLPAHILILSPGPEVQSLMNSGAPNPRVADRLDPPMAIRVMADAGKDRGESD